MGGFLRFLALFVVLAAIVVLVVIPLAAGPILTGMVRDMGMRSDSLQVTVALFDPTIVLGRSRSMHVSANNVDLDPAEIGSLELTLGGVSFFDRTWQTIDGDLGPVTVTTGGETLTVGSLRVNGPAAAAGATARFEAADAEELIRFAAGREGLNIQAVRFATDGVHVTVRGVETQAQLEVRGGALILQAGSDPGGVPLIQPAPTDAWQLDEAWISDNGLNVRGTVDTTRLAGEVTGVQADDAAGPGE